MHKNNTEEQWKLLTAEEKASILDFLESQRVYALERKKTYTKERGQIGNKSLDPIVIRALDSSAKAATLALKLLGEDPEEEEQSGPAFDQQRDGS